MDGLRGFQTAQGEGKHLAVKLKLGSGIPHSDYRVDFYQLKPASRHKKGTPSWRSF
jgi:hypothetical protein